MKRQYCRKIGLTLEISALHCKYWNIMAKCYFPILVHNFKNVNNPLLGNILYYYNQNSTRCKSLKNVLPIYFC